MPMVFDICSWVRIPYLVVFHLFSLFIARVLLGKTTDGDASTRVCPPGFDTTGRNMVYVTYHDAQAYGEYLISFR